MMNTDFMMDDQDTIVLSYLYERKVRESTEDLPTMFPKTNHGVIVGTGSEKQYRFGPVF